MAITREGKRLINFHSLNGTTDALFGGGVMFLLGAGSIDEQNQRLGMQLFTAPGSVRDVYKIPSKDGEYVTDMSVLVANISGEIGAYEVTEAALAIDGTIVAIQNLTLTSGEGFKLVKNPNGSTYIEWALARKRYNVPKVLSQTEEYTLKINPLVSESNYNQGLLSNLGNITFLKDDISVLERGIANVSRSFVEQDNGDFLLNLSVSLLPSDAVQGAYKYNTILELNIGAVTVGEPGLFTVTWNKVMEKATQESFNVEFSLLFSIEV